MVNFEEQMEQALTDGYGKMAEEFIKAVEMRFIPQFEIDDMEIFGHNMTAHKFCRAFGVKTDIDMTLSEIYIDKEKNEKEYWKVHLCGVNVHDIQIHRNELVKLLSLAIKNGWRNYVLPPKTIQDCEKEIRLLKEKNQMNKARIQELEKKIDEVVRLVACICD